MIRRALLAVTLCLAAACSSGTYVKLDFEANGVVGGKTIVLDLTLGALHDTVTITAPASFPSSAVLDLQKGEGQLTIVGELRDGSGATLASQTLTNITIVRGKTTTTTMVFGVASPDLTAVPHDLAGVDFAGDLAVDLAKPDLAGPPILTLTAALVDGASGTVTLDGAACTPTCTKTYAKGDAVTIVATPGAAFGMEVWPAELGGCDVDKTTCTFNIQSSVTATVRLTPVNRIFFSSEAYAGDTTRLSAGTDLGTVKVDWDAECQRLAAAALLPAADRYRAWYSTAARAAPTLFTAPSGPSRGWLRMDGKPFADSLLTLAMRQDYYPVRFDEKADDARTLIPDGRISVWTGIQADGTVDAMTCNNFTSTSTTGSRGHVMAGGSGWTARNPAIACDTFLPILCMGTAYRVRVAPTPVSGKRAFLSTPIGSGGLGVATMDQHCRDDAVAAGLCATSDFASCGFISGVAQNGFAMAGRFNTSSAPWVRLDGVQVAADRTSFFSGKLDAPLYVTATGVYTVRADVWTGIPGGGDGNTVGTAGSTCGGWAATTGNGGSGENFLSNRDALQSGMLDCGTTTARLYCLED